MGEGEGESESEYMYGVEEKNKRISGGWVDFQHRNNQQKAVFT